MNALCWNCRGLGNPSTVQELTRLINQKKPLLVFLMETKLTKSEFAPLLNTLGLDYFFVVDCDTTFGGRRGGLCLLWNDPLKLGIRSYSSHHVDADILPNSGIGEWRLTGIYGWAEEPEKHRTWQLIRDLKGTHIGPWLCMGDFNEILYSHEKFGGALRDPKKMEAFWNTIDACGLEDLGYIGSHFTWTNGQEEPNNIQERLDRCLANSDWSRLFPTARVNHLIRLQSDHCPIHLAGPSNQNRRRKKRFRFEAMWLQDPSCADKVKESWRSEIPAPRPACFAQKVCRLGNSLLTWEKEHFGHISSKVASLRRDLESLQKESPTPEKLVQIRHVETELRVLSRKEELMWKQRARTTWLAEGDKNTSFFHQTASGRKKRNTIHRILNLEGTWVDDESTIEHSFLNYFRSIFCSEEAESIDEVLEALTPKISPEICNKLCEKFSDEDVVEALNQMHPLKAPGPDGIPALFYTRFWPTIKNDLLTMTLNILNNGVSPAPINHTHITLIPKLKNPETPKDFRPISLCNVSIKLVTKCLANRLKPFLPDIISPAQSAFVPGRLITDNALLAFELFHSMKTIKSRSRACFGLKLDMSKAYDRVEWDFLEQVLRRLGFGGNFLGTIMRCVTTVSYSILINGKPTDSFKPSRGLRQGDPLSPYLFLFCAEAFSALIQQAETGGRLKGAKICKNAPSISHLFFADDSLVFGRATHLEIANVRNIIEKYTRASGQRVNFEKSEMVFSNGLPREQTEYLGSIGGVKVVDKIAVYLGLPTTIGRSKKEIFNTIIDRIRKKLKNWKCRSLSMAGKLTLIKSVAQSIPSYVMSCFSLPRSVIQTIDKIISNFLWGQKQEERKIHWCSWSSTCSHKLSGGLGLRDLEAFNLAFLAKQGWRLLTCPDSLLARCLKARYFPRTSFLDAQRGFNPSYTWRSILEGRSIFHNNIRWNIRNGHSVNIWTDPWIPDLSSLTPPPPSSILQDFKIVRDLMNEEGSDWNFDVICSCFPSDVARRIFSIPICTTSQEDCLQWTKSKNGAYSVKTGYWVAKRLKDIKLSIPSSSSSNPSCWKWIWSLNIPPKLKFFAWRCMRGILPSKVNLRARGVEIDPVCSRCGETIETSEHAVRDCSWSSFFWSVCPLRISSSDLSTRMSLQDWILLIIKGKSGDFVEVFIMLLWTAWKARNSSIFQLQTPPHSHWISMALSLLMEFQSCKVIPLSPAQRALKNLPINSPPCGWVRLNTDASLSNTGLTGLGGAIRDSNSNLLHIISTTTSSPIDIDTAEAQACLHGIRKARNSGYRAVLLEVDCQNLALALQSGIAPRTYFGALVQDILDLSKGLDWIYFKWINRSCNRLAHEIANLARNSVFIPDDQTLLPVALQRIVAADAARFSLLN